MPYSGYLLFSGGLDSILAARVLQEQNIKVTGVTLVSNFFDAEKARESAQKIGIDLEEVDISREMIEIVKDPAHGHGKNLNPCIDCHMFMLKKLKEKFL
ncbi:MAG TPA: asparagine synthase-related protein, partial [Patescibacteria group bacterium]|nr:asparagine synthase-related protein [Patescibacteria group bacterium]